MAASLPQYRCEVRAPPRSYLLQVDVGAASLLEADAAVEPGRRRAERRRRAETLERLARLRDGHADAGGQLQARHQTVVLGRERDAQGGEGVQRLRVQRLRLRGDRAGRGTDGVGGNGRRRPDRDGGAGSGGGAGGSGGTAVGSTDSPTVGRGGRSTVGSTDSSTAGRDDSLTVGRGSSSTVGSGGSSTVGSTDSLTAGRGDSFSAGRGNSFSVGSGDGSAGSLTVGSSGCVGGIVCRSAGQTQVPERGGGRQLDGRRTGQAALRRLAAGDARRGDGTQAARHRPLRLRTADRDTSHSVTTGTSQLQRKLATTDNNLTHRQTDFYHIVMTVPIPKYLEKQLSSHRN